MGVTRVNTSHGVKYRARVTINKQRISLGQFDRRYKAEAAIESHYRKNGIEYEPTGTREEQFENAMDKHLDDLKSGKQVKLEVVKPRQMGRTSFFKRILGIK